MKSEAPMDRVGYHSLVVQDLINYYRALELNVNPWYQRRSVWNNPQKSYLINTLFEKKPIPAIYIRHSIDLDLGKSIKEVVDGQQRTRTILEYCEDKFTARHPSYLNRVSFKDLNKTERQDFLLTAIPVGYLLGADDADVIDIFGRINSVSKSLNAQEKRNANFSGEFKQFCLEQASSRINFWRNYSIFTSNDIARMNEVQFISDIVLNFIVGLSDFSPTKLSKAYEDYDADFPQRSEVESRLNRAFDFLGNLPENVLSETIFSRQPLFFSLIVVIDAVNPKKIEKVSEALLEIDARFNSDENLDDADLAFVKASTSTTQRIAQRRIRDSYIRRFIQD